MWCSCCVHTQRACALLRLELWGQVSRCWVKDEEEAAWEWHGWAGLLVYVKAHCRFFF